MVVVVVCGVWWEQRRSGSGWHFPHTKKLTPHNNNTKSHNPSPSPTHNNNNEQGVFWSGSADREYAEFAWYYGLPTLSVKACCHREMAAGARGFEAVAPREGREGLKGKAFYYDHIHPDGNTGHR